MNQLSLNVFFLLAEQIKIFQGDCSRHSKFVWFTYIPIMVFGRFLTLHNFPRSCARCTKEQIGLCRIPHCRSLLLRRRFDGRGQTVNRRVMDSKSYFVPKRRL
jgi:hypothetical protein